jgi:methylated-DNA-[protein]-cysteine S-methyltransferase
MTSTTWTEIDSPVGRLRLVADDGSLVALDFLGPMPDGPGEAASVRLHRDRGADPPPEGSRRDDDDRVLAAAAVQLAAYFAGELEQFDLPLAPRGTAFQQLVWAELRRIPYGTTASYGEIAARLGLSGHGARAVGVANGRNPIPVVVPCHRVVGASGALTGYGGGMERKRVLLDLEGSALFSM